MKGIIFNLTESFIVTKYGEDIFDEIIDDCELVTKDPFVGPGTYPDKDLFEIIGKSTGRLKMPVEEFLRQLGVYVFPYLAKMLPTLVDSYTHPKDFLKTIHETVHVEVMKVVKNAEPPNFSYEEPSKDELIITYFSKRKLYPFMEGLITGVAVYFNSPIEQSHTIYVKESLEYCDFHLKFTY